jgi:ABC-type antimicrobial peptide transport system permease subunit
MSTSKASPEAAEPAIYVPVAQAAQSNGVLLVRTPADRQAMISSLRGVFQQLDPQLAVFGVEPLEQTVSASIAKARFTSTLLALFGSVAILLALVGVHGVLSYTVAQRSQEVGIRMALGATRSNVVGLVVGEGARLAVLGTAIGLAGALAGSQLLAGLVFGVTPRDLTTFVAVTIGVLSLAALASWLPAQRAARGDPMRALRSE